MARSVRVYLKQHAPGRTPRNHNIGGFGITNRSVAMVTAAPCEIGGPPGLFPTNFDGFNKRLNVHGPEIRVTNVVCHGPEGGDGGVEYVLNIDSPGPVDVAVTITLFEQFESFT